VQKEAKQAEVRSYELSRANKRKGTHSTGPKMQDDNEKLVGYRVEHIIEQAAHSKYRQVKILAKKNTLVGQFITAEPKIRPSLSIFY